MTVAESAVKWSHVHNDDRANDLLITPTATQIIQSMIELNNVWIWREFEV